MRMCSAGSNGAGRIRQASGVTLLELMVVLTILTLLAGLATPGIGRWLDAWKLRGAAERVAQTIRYGRTRAIYEQRYYVVELTPEANRVRMLEPTSGFLREYDLPQNIRWEEEGKSPPSSAFRLILAPSGAVAEKTLLLRSRQGGSVKIHLDFLVGSPGIEIARQGP